MTKSIIPEIQPVPCTLDGFTYGTLNAWAYPGACVTDTWCIRSACGIVSIRVRATLAQDRVDSTHGLPVFMYD